MATLTNSERTDQHFATTPALAERRIRAIFANNAGGRQPDAAKMRALVNNVMTRGFRYFNTIRADPTRYLSQSTRTTPERGNPQSTRTTPPRGNPAADPAADPQSPDFVAPRDFRAEAQGRFPWLTGQLLDLFAQFWADTGSSDAALGRLRQTSDYDLVFDGIKREDGTLRMTEGEYFADKAGFTEGLREFGLSPAQYEKRYGELIRNDVRAVEFLQAAGSGFQRFVEPGSNDLGLFERFVDAFISTGAEQVALSQVRGSSEYDAVFRGNRREDGTLRMDEPEYFAYVRGWRRLFLSRGLSHEPFESKGRLVDAIEGEVSIQELDARIGAMESGILGNTADTQATFLRFYGEDGVNFLAENGTLESALAMAIDPDVGTDLLQRRITASQIGGEAQVQGFLRDVNRAEELARAGLDQGQARGLFSQAAQQLPGLTATTQRFNRGGTSLTDFEDAFALGDSRQRTRLNRALQEESSQFSQRGDVRRSRDGFGLSGLRQR
jgi:hypothetical protein